MSSEDFEDDPLNQGGNRNWGSAKAMDDLAYLASDIEQQKVGPVGLLSASFAVIRERPLVLALCGALAGGAVFGLEAAIATPLRDALVPFVGDKVGSGLPQSIILLVVWCSGVLLQGPLTGAALEAKSERKDLLPLFGRRAMAGFKTLLVISLLNLAIALGTIVTWVLVVSILVKLAGVLGGFFGLLVLAIGAVTSLVAAYGVIFRFCLAAPVHLVERLKPVAAFKRSAELTRGTALALVAAAFAPVLFFVVGTILLGTFGALRFEVVATAWMLGAYAGYMMLAMAFIPAAYIVYRHYVDEIPPHKLAHDIA